MSKPQRIQRKRTKGWRMPEGAVYVGRPTKWGNPFVVSEDRDARDAVLAFHSWLTVDGVTAGIPDRKNKILESLDELRGKDLVCWCKPGEPCHADVLLKLANSVEALHA